jgi:hypothetical protein
MVGGMGRILVNLKKLRQDHLKIQHDLTFYPYQLEISNKIINSLVQNLRLTTRASEEDIKKLRQVELSIEISRQAGKTTAVVHTVEIIMAFLSEHYSRPIHIGIFAPQIEQARTDFEKLKNALRPIKDLIVQDDETKAQVKERENAKTLVLPNGSSCWIAPVTTTSKPESKTFDLMIFEEAQDIDDKIMKESIFPIGSTTNAPRIFIGTAGTRRCYFRELGHRKQDTIKIYFDDIVKQRREVYEYTGDAHHLIYEQTISQEIVKFGIESDEIQRPYFGKWLIGTGNFTTEEEIDALETDRNYTYSDKKNDCYAGLDTAKHPDSSVLTIIRYNKETKTKELINWLELRGDNYQHQFEVFVDALQKYNLIAIAIDSTGQGDFMPDLFAEQTEWRDELSGLFRVKFSQVSKDKMYKNLKVTIKESLTTLPKLSIKNGERFRQQMLDLEQQYKGQLLSVKHPDDPKAHDDYPDSWALAEWAYARWQEQSTVDVASIGVDKDNQRDIKRDDSGKIQDYWPGLEGW